MSTDIRLSKPIKPDAPRLFLPEILTALPLPADALAAGIAGIGLAGGYLLQSVTSTGSTLCFVIAIIAGGLPAVPEAVTSLKKHRLDVHLLMLTAAIGAAAIGKTGEGAMLLFLFALSGALEAFAMGRTRDAIRRLVGMRPTQARREDGALVPVETLNTGDTFVVHPAEAFPLDGIVLSGVASVDQSIMTGESEPVSRSVGDRVVSGTLNLDGILSVQATSARADSSLERVIHLVEAAQEEKSLASSERLADRVGHFYAPLVLIAGVVIFFYELLFHGEAPAHAIYHGLTLLVAASPCALILSSPAAILSALAAAGRQGLLIRNGSVLEALAQIDSVAFDKTGTLTTGHPTVVSVWSSNGDNAALQRLAAAAEAPSPHPLARAVVRAAQEAGLTLPVASDYLSLPGCGVIGTVEGKQVRVGRPEWLFDGSEGVDLQERIARTRQAGQSVIGIVAGSVVGLIALEDTLRPDAVPTLRRLRDDLGIRQRILLTGDHAQAARALRVRLPELNEGFADQSPEDKTRAIQRLRAEGRHIAMVGDGVNDAPALASATVGITLGGIGSDVALDSADMVVMEDRLSAVPEALLLARRAKRIATQNVVVSLTGVGLLVLLVLFRGVPLPLAVVCHEGTTVLVVLNGLRLLSTKRS